MAEYSKTGCFIYGVSMELSLKSMLDWCTMFISVLFGQLVKFTAGIQEGVQAKFLIMKVTRL